MSAFGGKADIEDKLLTHDRPPRSAFPPMGLVAPQKFAHKNFLLGPSEYLPPRSSRAKGCAKVAKEPYVKKIIIFAKGVIEFSGRADFGGARWGRAISSPLAR